MKVRELIQDLLLADPGAEVLMASDAEANDIKPFDEWVFATLDENGELITPDFNNPKGFNAIVLYPV